MLKLASILIFVSLSYAKIAKNQLKLFETNDYQSLEILKGTKRDVNLKSNDSLWILNLLDDSLDFQRLYLARKADEKVFKNIIFPAIENYKLQRSIIVNKENSKKVQPVDEKQIERINKNSEANFNIIDLKGIKNEILVLMNKFFMNQLSDPNSYLSEIGDRNEHKTLKLYFIGPFTSLIMTSNKMRYHYFINPPSPLPSWFYGEHKNIVESENKKYVAIPVAVQNDFLKKLLNLLKIYIGFPV